MNEKLRSTILDISIGAYMAFAICGHAAMCLFFGVIIVVDFFLARTLLLGNEEIDQGTKETG